MDRQSKKKNGLPSGIKQTIAIVCGIFVALGILFFSNTVTTVKKNPYFNYTLKENQQEPVQVRTGEKVEIPFEFRVDEKIYRINFELAGMHGSVPGIALSNIAAVVEEGRAEGKIVLQINSDEDLKAGSHVLTVIAKDSDTGAVVQEGEIMITFNMLKVIAGCSC